MLLKDCKYCSQSSRYKTHVKPTPTMQIQEVVESAKKAKEAGSTRFCMGAAWRDVGMLYIYTLCVLCICNLYILCFTIFYI